MSHKPIKTDSDGTGRLCSALRVTSGEAAMTAVVLRFGNMGERSRIRGNRRTKGIAGMASELIGTDSEANEGLCFALRVTSGQAAMIADNHRGECLGASARTLRIKRLAAVPVVTNGIGNSPRSFVPSYDPDTAAGPYLFPPRTSGPSDDPDAAVGPCRNSPRSRGPSAIIGFLEGLWSMPGLGHAARRRERGAGIRRNRRMKRKQDMQWN